jgi:hypothetical protein
VKREEEKRKEKVMSTDHAVLWKWIFNIRGTAT